MTDSSPIYFVGPLPPPVHGFSEINRRMLEALRINNNVVVFDMAPRNGIFGIVCQWFRFTFGILRRKPKSVYLGFSGGRRQIFDLAYLLVAYIGGSRVFIHHHSFSYLDSSRLMSYLCFKLAGSATHIILCDCMADRLVGRYGIDVRRTRVLSNAAFLEDRGVESNVDASSDTLRVGFLSNITAEKGIFEFISVLQGASQFRIALRGVIAGPVDSSIQDDFVRSITDCHNVEHIGAVYGEAKKEFFAGIDVLLFPSRYAAEAEPVTILEAMAHGVPVIAFSRGCIERMIPDDAGAVFPYSENFVSLTMAELRRIGGNSVAMSESRKAARCAFEKISEVNKRSLDCLISEISGMNFR